MPDETVECKVYMQDLLTVNLKGKGKSSKDNSDYLDSLDDSDNSPKNEVKLFNNRISSSKLNLCTLPTEILLRILYELIVSENPYPPKTAVLSLPLVSRALYKLANDRIIWEQVFLSEYDTSARKRRFSVCNFRKIYYRRSLLNADLMNSSLDGLENCLKNKSLSEKEQQKVLDRVLDVLTRLWVLVSEDGKVYDICHQNY